MHKYTFVTVYRGGIYIYQYKAPDLETALHIWAENLDKKYFTALKKARVLEELAQPHPAPVPVENIRSVWFTTFLSGKFLIELYIFETA